jgi:hypothetical protein
MYLLNIKVSCRGSAILGPTFEIGPKRANQHRRKYAHIFSEPEVDYCMSLNNMSFGSSRSGNGGIEWIDLAQDMGRWWGACKYGNETSDSIKLGEFFFD